MPADRPSSEEHPDNEQVRRDEQPIDTSPASGAVDPEHAAQDQSTEMQTGRHGYTDNATYIAWDLDAPSNDYWPSDDEDNEPPDDEPTDDWYDEMMGESDVEDYPDTVDPLDSRWRTLNQANRDFKATGTTDDPETTGVEQERRRQDLTNDTITWGHYIGLTNTEIERAIRLVDDAEGDWTEGYGYDAIILAALTIVANQGEPEYSGVHKIIRPNRPDPEVKGWVEDGELAPTYRKPETMVDAYTELREGLDVPPDAVRTCRAHLS